MKFLHRHKPTVFRFRRWSRKGYAAFCSLGKLITIGRGGKSIADASLRKQGTMSVSSHLLYGSADSMDQENPPESTTPSSVATFSSVTASLVMEALVLALIQYQPAAQCRFSFHSTGAFSLFTATIHTARTILYLFHQYSPRCVFACGHVPFPCHVCTPAIYTHKKRTPPLLLT